MTLPTFALAASERWAEVAARVCVGLAAAVLLGWGARRGIDGLLLTAAVLIWPVLWAVARPGWRTAWRVVVSDEYIEATGYGGARVRLAWDGVGEIQHFLRTSPCGPIRVLRLLSIDRQHEIVFNNRLPGFEPLMGLVEMRARHVGAGTPSSWGRLLWSKAPGGEAWR